MSEKTSLLQSIPAIQDSSSDAGKSTLLSSDSTRQPANDAAGKQNSVVADFESGAGAAVVDSGESETTQTVASESTPAEAQTITAFQYATYASFVLNFILAGFAAAVLFKKLVRLPDERFSASVRALAIGFVVVVLYGFFATYLYASYLNDPSRPVPLFVTMALWVLLGPAVGYATRNLLARKEKPNRLAAVFDGFFYAVIFALSAFGLSPSVNTNGALLLTITACFLVVVPMARSLTAYKVASARHPELKEASSKILLYVLLFLPALLPVLAVLHVFGMSDLLTLFLVNFITIDFVIIVSSSVLITSSNFEQEPEQGEAAVANATTQQTPAAPAAAPAAAPQIPQDKKEKIVTGNPDDPIIQFLNSEDSESEPDASAKAEKPKNAPRIQPPRKPAHPGLSAPKKPASGSGKAAPNAPQKVKAPAKPKKRS